MLPGKLGIVLLSNTFQICKITGIVKNIVF